MARQHIPKSIRFEVLKRDSFKCQYCGAAAPNVLLEIDHIKPVAGGGTNDITNLVTSCEGCNAGKSDRLLSENAAVNKSKAQLDALQERREQLEMMMNWQEGLRDLQGEAMDWLASYWSALAPGYHLTQAGLNELRKLLQSNLLSEISEAMEKAATHYLEFEEGASLPTSDSVNLAWSKVPGTIYISKKCEESPELSDLLYVRGIVRRRLEGRYYVPHLALDWLKAAYSWGVTIDEMKSAAKLVRSWRNFSDAVDELIAEAKRRRQ